MKTIFGLLMAAMLVAEETPTLRVIVINPEAKPVVEGVHIEKLQLPGSREALEKVLHTFLGQALDLNTLKKIKLAICKHYVDEGRPFVLVETPEPTPEQKEEGVAAIEVRESVLGKVKIVGHKWTKKNTYTKSLHLKAGQPIQEPQLMRDIDFINRSPFRSVELSYSPGDQPYTTDVVLNVKDRRPILLYSGVDNTGVPTTGRQRIFLGFGYDQVAGLDQSFFYQYTTNYEGHKYYSHIFQYQAMLSNEAVLKLFGGWSILHANLTPAPMSNKGTNIQASIRYIQPFTPTASFSHELMAGFDIKNTNNTIEFTDTFPVIGQTVNLTQWMVGYKCRYDLANYKITGAIETFFSPFQWIPGQSEADFETLRPNADNQWIYALGFLKVSQDHAYGLSSHYQLKAQYCPEVLLPSEQLGLGGMDTVRGYDERQYNGDSGLVGSYEFHTPHFTFLKTKSKQGRNEAFFVAFIDGGVGFDNASVPLIPIKNYLVGTGAGFRFYMGPYLNARVDYGFKLHNQADFTGGPSEIHFSVIGSF